MESISNPDTEGWPIPTGSKKQNPFGSLLSSTPCHSVLQPSCNILSLYKEKQLSRQIPGIREWGRFLLGTFFPLFYYFFFSKRGAFALPPSPPPHPAASPRRDPHPCHTLSSFGRISNFSPPRARSVWTERVQKKKKKSKKNRFKNIFEGEKKKKFPIRASCRRDPAGLK